MTENYIARVHDILVHTRTIGSQGVYRVIEVALGGCGQEGLVKLQPLGRTLGDVDGVDGMHPYIPALMVDDMVRRGIVECVWRRERND